MGYTTEDLIVFEPLFDPSARNGTSYFEFHPSELSKTNACYLRAIASVDGAYHLFVTYGQ
jgi:hypothetical protein